MSSRFFRFFPLPSFFTIPTVGLDFSDATMRFIRFREGRHGLLPADYGALSIPPGCMKEGRIDDEKKFIDFLKGVRKKYGIKYVRVSIPESQVYSFTLPLDSAAKDDLRGSIELMLEDTIPLKSTEAIFDYQILFTDEKHILVQVVAISEKTATAYLDAFARAGLVPVSFELDGQAAARAVLRPDDARSCMLVDIGATRTGITIITNSIAVYTSTLDFGGAMVVEKIMHERSVSLEEAHRLVHLYGFNAMGAEAAIVPLLSEVFVTLKEEINRRYIYWQERKDQFVHLSAIDQIYLCGGYSTIEGVAEYLSTNLKLPVTAANPWINCLSFHEVIPLLTQVQAQSYVTAIGLALSDYLYD
ncbi:MAG TPA: pilus assembly protein PilM [Candidatus Paceibacterota bacterium]|nr:pilus assembly protein PilM [Candidatus Paceibacterota bacterium]